MNFVVAGADLPDPGHGTNRDIQLAVAVTVKSLQTEVKIAWLSTTIIGDFADPFKS